MARFADVRVATGGVSFHVQMVKPDGNLVLNETFPTEADAKQFIRENIEDDWIVVTFNRYDPDGRHSLLVAA